MNKMFLKIACLVLIGSNILLASDRELATVNGESIKISDVNRMVGITEESYNKMPKNNQMELLNKIIDHVLLRQNAVKEISINNPEYKSKLKAKKDDLILKTWFDKMREEADIKLNY